MMDGPTSTPWFLAVIGAAFTATTDTASIGNIVGPVWFRAMSSMTSLLATTTWQASLGLLRLVVYGSLAGLALAVVILLAIWWHEWRSGKAW